MSRTLGTVVRGVRAPIFREGDDVVRITADTVLNALKDNGITARDGDIVAVTESVVARCQGNYATVEQIAADVTAKTGGQTVGVTFPILSRNRFSLLLQGIASGAKKVVLVLSYPSDEVGNHLVSMDQLDEAGIDPWHDVLSLAQFRDAFGSVIHPFTGVDYVDYYKSIIESAGAEAEIVFANRVQAVLDYTDTVICCDIHTRQRSKRLLTAAGANLVLGLDDLLTAPVDGSVEGTITYNTPSIMDGFTYENVCLTFSKGRIVESTSNDNERIKAVFDRDAGARGVGEFAIGVNPFVTFPMRDTLFDEKISGSFHFTPGCCYDDCNNGNKSCIHWDLVCIQTPEYGGGEMYFDDVLIRKDGRFVLPELDCLNPENLK